MECFYCEGLVVPCTVYIGVGRRASEMLTTAGVYPVRRLRMAAESAAIRGWSQAGSKRVIFASASG